MTANTTPASAGRITRAVIAAALLIPIIASALFVPAMAGDDECHEVCPTTCAGLGPWDGFWCQLFHPCVNTCHVPPVYDPGI